MKRPKSIVLIALAALLAAAQLLPYPPAENPPRGTELAAPDEVRAVLRASCYDCHSNETVWPWYSHLIPGKWFVRLHVAEGRSRLNFSTWGEYAPERANRKLEGVIEYVEEGRMPLKSYVRLHPEAELTREDRGLIIDWARSLRGGAIPAEVEGPR